MARSSRAALALVAACMWSDPVSAGGLQLHVIPVAGASAGHPERIAAVSSNPEGLAAALGSVARLTGPNRVEIELHSYPQLEPVDPARYRESSFVLDFDTDSFRALYDRVGEKPDETLDLQALVRWTDAAIPVKSMRRGWDLASQVAARGEGDCSEHAVLLAALARSFGRPARVVFGLLLTRDGPRGPLRAYGHAWAEVYQQGRWMAVDATPIPGSGAPQYLPLALIRDEGPGFAWGIARSFQRGWVQRIEVLETDG